MGLYSSKMNSELQGQVASVAVTLEALENVLTRRGVIEAGELMREIGKLITQKVQHPELVPK
jgi:hypothetical protein